MTTRLPERPGAKSERRFAQRKKLHAPLEMEWGDAILNGTVRDIGPRGLFVEMMNPLWIGAAFRARLVLQPDLLLDCTVARVEPGKGIAVIFDFPELEGRARLEALLTSLSPA